MSTTNISGKATVRFLILAAGVLFSVLAATASNEPTPTKQEKIAPKMRVMDRDWSYFKSVKCDDIQQIVFHSRSEEILLAKRKKQCLDKYKAFLPVPVKQ